MTNIELIEKYLNSISLLNKKTVLLYRSVLKSLSAAFQKSFLQLTSAEIRAYIIGKKETHRWTKANTITKHITVLKSFFKFLVFEKLLKEEDNPIKSIKAPPCRIEGELRIFNAEEIRKLIKAAESRMIELRTRLLFYLVLTSGLRASEIASIKKRNVDFEKQLIYIPQEDVKGQYREKYAPISNRTKELINGYCIKYSNNTEYLLINRFGKQLSYRMIYRAIKDVIDIAYPYKNSWKKPSGPNMGRHTFASRWIESGGDHYALKAIMGWSSFKQFDRYVYMSPSYISKAAQKIERKLLKG